MFKLTSKFIVVVAATCLTVLSCASEEEDDSVLSSQFKKELSKKVYEKVDPPSVTPILRWDFSKENVVHEYLYEQEVRAKSESGRSLKDLADSPEEVMSGKGTLRIRSQGDNTAELVLKDLRMSMEIDTGEDEPKTMQQQMPPVVLQGLNEDGSCLFGGSSQDALLKLLFPLPLKSINVGESVDVPAQMPFNAMGSMLLVKGRSQITLAHYVEIDGRTCAKFDVDIEISELKVPAELEGEFICSTKGKSVFYFDVYSRSFVSGTVSLLMQFSIDVPTPQVGGEEKSDTENRMKMSMLSDNLITVDLK